MIDRLEYAKRLCAGKRVVDIGGARMTPDGDSLFDREYKKLRSVAGEYTLVDKWGGADVVIDFDTDAITLPPCDVVLCMEVLEHLRNPGHVCRAIAETGAEVFITVSRATGFMRYIEANGLGRYWGKCEHLYSFPRHHLDVFLRHNFPERTRTVFPCLCRYSKLWPLVWLATLGRGLSWGVVV